jgi:hypothetical protein
MRQIVTAAVVALCVCGAFVLGYTVKRVEPAANRAEAPSLTEVPRPSPVAAIPADESLRMPDLSQRTQGPAVEPVDRNDLNFRYIALTLGVDTGSLLPSGTPKLEILESAPERGPMPREVPSAKSSPR